jgi:arylsulfatase A
MNFLSIALGALLAMPCTWAARPNVVLVLADDLGWGDVGCYNRSSNIPTPHLDNLAKQGLRFTDAHSSSGVCVPSRFSLMTGRHAFRMVGGGNQSTKPLVPEGCVTLPGLFASAGYATSMIGKWHLGFDDLLKRPSEPLRGGPLDRGFQRFFGIPSSLDIEPYLFIDGNRIVAQATENMAAHGSKGFSDERMGEFWRAGKAAPGFKHADVFPELTRRALDELRRLAASAAQQPFFFYYAMPAPHSPLLPSVEFRGKSQVGIYGDYVVQTDDVVGRVLRVLDETGVAENTLVFFSSDNGPFWYPADVQRTGHAASGPWRGLKGDAWEGGHRVPFIARWPGKIAADASSDATISLTDLLATAAELLGLPQEKVISDGADFSPALLGRTWTRPEDRPLVARSSLGANSIRVGFWKLIDQLGSGGFSTPQKELPAVNGSPVQLYNLSTDPGEKTNVAAGEPQRVAILQKQLDSLRDSVLPDPTQKSPFPPRK